MKLDHTRFLETISGTRTGILAEITRAFLFGLSLVYRLAIGLRNWAYDSGWKTTHHVELPVISVGNLTTGGTGKTPFVIWLASQLKEQHQVTIVSRGYGSTNDELNDEGREIEQRLAGIMQVQNPNRVLAVQKLINRPASTATSPAVILDDGFQHRRLGRDLDIVLIDATCPFGYESLLPRGLLREPLSSITRSQLVVLTRSNLVGKNERNKIKRRLISFNSDLLWAEGELQIGGWISTDRTEHEFGLLQGQRLLAFCGIGNPNGFIQTLQRSGCVVVETVFFDDHQNYNIDDIVRVVDAAKRNRCDAIVCTHKDLVKLDFQIPGKIPVLALLTEFRVTVGEELLNEAIRNVLPKLENTR